VLWLPGWERSLQRRLLGAKQRLAASDPPAGVSVPGRGLGRRTDDLYVFGNTPRYVMFAHGEEILQVVYAITLTLDALGVLLVYMAMRLRGRSWSFLALTALLLAVSGAYAWRDGSSEPNPRERRGVSARRNGARSLRLEASAGSLRASVP
jgi:hypothetical protein